MCIIEAKTYVYPNGDRQKMPETIRPCKKSKNGRPCRSATRETSESKIREVAPSSSSQSSSPFQGSISPNSPSFPPGTRFELREPKGHKRTSSSKSKGKERASSSSSKLATPGSSNERLKTHRVIPSYDSSDGSAIYSETSTRYASRPSSATYPNIVASSPVQREHTRLYQYPPPEAAASPSRQPPAPTAESDVDDDDPPSPTIRRTYAQESPIIEQSQHYRRQDDDALLSTTSTSKSKSKSKSKDKGKGRAQNLPPIETEYSNPYSHSPSSRNTSPPTPPSPPKPERRPSVYSKTYVSRTDPGTNSRTRTTSQATEPPTDYARLENLRYEERARNRAAQAERDRIADADARDSARRRQQKEDRERARDRERATKERERERAIAKQRERELAHEKKEADKAMAREKSQAEERERIEQSAVALHPSRPGRASMEFGPELGSLAHQQAYTSAQQVQNWRRGPVEVLQVDYNFVNPGGNPLRERGQEFLAGYSTRAGPSVPPPSQGMAGDDDEWADRGTYPDEFGEEVPVPSRRTKGYSWGNQYYGNDRRR